MRRIVTASIALLAVALLQGQPPKVDRTKPPETPPLPGFKLPPVGETKLPNGLTVVVVEDARFPVTTIRLAFGSGDKYDPADAPGLAEGVAAVMTQGTKTRTARQIAEEAAAAGGAINASASSDSLTVGASALAENFAKMLDLVADVAQNANFPADEVGLYQQNRKQELMAERSQSEFLAAEKFYEVVFGDNPYARRSPTMAALDKLNGESLSKFRDTYLAPNNAWLILLGKLPARAEVNKLVAAKFGSWKKREIPMIKTPAPPEPKRTITVVDRPGSVQADVMIGQLGLTRLEKDYFPLLVGNTILGGGASSRLFNDIREKKGFAYSVHSAHTPFKQAGLFRTMMQVRNEVVTDAVSSMLEHMEQMGKAPVTSEELSNVKNYLSGNFVMSLETQNGVAAQVANMKVLELPKDYLETYTARIRSTEPDQIQEAAKKIIAPEDATIVVVGDAGKVAPAMEKFGKAEVVKAQ